jgi:hypothetical protein
MADGKQWFFRDRSNKTQGPYSDAEMRAWYEAGFLNADLPICKGDVRKGFTPLSEYFPTSAVAFLAEDQVRRQQQQGGGPAEAGQWYFVDKQQAVQGPFSDIHMRQWHMANYFDPSLQIMNAASGQSKWTTLREAFPNNADAFLGSGSRPGMGKPGASVSAMGANNGGASRFVFPEWLPAPPRYKGVKKTYPSEKSGKARHNGRVAITDVHGHAVQAFQHARVAN